MGWRGRRNGDWLEGDGEGWNDEGKEGKKQIASLVKAPYSCP